MTEKRYKTLLGFGFYLFVNWAIVSTHNFTIQLIIVLWELLTFFSFIHFNICPLEILYRFKFNYFKAARRAYKKNYLLSLLIYVGFVVFCLINIILKYI